MRVSFQILHMEGGTYIEAKGLGALIRKPLQAYESPFTAADNFWKSKNIHSFN